ncbi:hypothetical protein [Robiginitomaculum antarcticum]|uniref:hypothetical protein n=1 Tax=Robiginitomaculum antarcticum TaxID=437507 RepID=UPI0014614EC2|nr:hypothetical protein [Robiginitomaculum antarcticum]
MKSEAAGNVVTAGTAALGNAVVNQIPGAVDAVSNTLQDAGAAINDAAGQLSDMVQPEPMIDPERNY